MTAVTFPPRPPRLAFAICGRRWQNDEYENKILKVCVFWSLVWPVMHGKQYSVEPFSCIKQHALPANLTTPDPGN